MAKNCSDNYIGCTGDLYDWVADYAVPDEKERIRCKWKDRNTESQCITMLNRENIKNKNIYCLMHQAKLDYKIDTPWAPPKKSSNKENP